jgi:hypothetical protein
MLTYHPALWAPLLPEATLYTQVYIIFFIFA